MTVLTVNPNARHDPPIHDLLRRRRSPRAFSPEPVAPEKLRRLLEAARWAASASNEQPWRFVVVTQDQPQDFQRFLGFVKEGNRLWAQYAPVLLLSVAKRSRERDGGENRHALQDVGQATASLSIQALEDGLFVHQMGGFDVDKAHEVLGIPDGYEPVTVMAVGYPGDPAALPEALRERELAARTRKPFSELVFAGRWGASFPAPSGGVTKIGPASQPTGS